MQQLVEVKICFRQAKPVSDWQAARTPATGAAPVKSLTLVSRPSASWAKPISCRRWPGCVLVSQGWTAIAPMFLAPESAGLAIYGLALFPQRIGNEGEGEGEE